MILFAAILFAHTCLGASWNLKAEVGDECWLEDFCRTSGTAEILTVKDTVDTASPEACYALCGKTDGCTFFSWRNTVNHGKFCHLLSNCDEKDPCSSPENCKSGPVDCSVVNPCPMLTYTAGSAIWSCDKLINPYKEQIPDGITCRTSCGGWKSSDGKETIAASAQCTNGAWSDVTTNYPTETTVNKPDVETTCSCLDFSLWYDPNEELGADFYCTKTLDFSVATPENPVLLDPTEECILICDNFIVADIQCVNGDWTDADPEVGIGCYRAPPSTPGIPTQPTSPTQPTTQQY